MTCSPSAVSGRIRTAATALGPRGRIERGFGRFERSLRVPRGLDPDAIEASLTDGVLHLRIPKPESLKPRKIEIKGGTETRQLDAAGQ